MNPQQGDVLLFQTNDDGNISVVNGIVEMTPGLGVAAYLALFGGNEDDTVVQDTNLSWWGNISETNNARQYRSETQNLIQSIPATSSNLIRIEDAAKRDLSFFLEQNIASSVTVLVTIPALNRIRIVVNIVAEGEESQFTFTENWKASV